MGLILPGDAQANDVRAGKRFSAGPNYNAVGSLADNGALGTINPSNSSQAIPAGITTGGTVAAVTNLVTGNIKAGAVVGGVAGKTEVVDTTTGAGATATQILAGREGFVNGPKVVGTMINQPSIVNPVNNVPSGNTLVLRIPPGAYLTPTGAGYPEVQISDPNWIAANIPASLSMFGLVGTGANVKRWATGIVLSLDLVISGLAFTPTLVMAYKAGAGSNGSITYITHLMIANKSTADIFDSTVGHNYVGLGEFTTPGAQWFFDAPSPTWTSSGVTLPSQSHGENNYFRRWYAFE